jgi:glyoxylase I family protein
MALDIRGVCPLVQVFDMPTSIRFYRSLGFDVIQSSPQLSEQLGDVNWAMLRLNDATIMLNSAYEPERRPSKPDPARIAAHDDTALFFGCPDVDQAYRQLRSLGLDVSEPKVAPYGMKQLNASDPDGYHLCFQWPA